MTSREFLRKLKKAAEEKKAEKEKNKNQPKKKGR